MAGAGGSATPQAARQPANKVGSVRKCPNCGAEIESFQARCPHCNHELNSVQVADSLQTFTRKLERAGSYGEQIEIIESFPIPNSKEDIFEFAILAVSKIKPEGAKTNSAWQTKLIQVNLKAQLAFGDDKASLEKLKMILDSAPKTR
jgi:RecJ-like exonuclease